jgi:beta-glucosidase-like glycosyl hydrolase/CubicO group peptidase (beta-lactamase class C family)
MKVGKFQQVIVGTVAFFKKQLMKIFLSFISIFILALFITECSSVKDKHAIVVIKNNENQLPKTDTLQEDIVTYSPKKYSKEKVNYFKETTQEKIWVDSLYNTMTLDEKLGQLFMVAAYSNKDEKHFSELDKLIKDYKIGGLIFFQGGPMRQAKLTNRYQSKSKIPLFIGIDAEWGLSMRLDSTYVYPWNMTLGAIDDLNLIQKVGENMGRESKRMGIHFNFSPVIDINTNPNNPIIGNRSFGEDKYNVTEKASALIQGIQSQGVFATGKHFPGHGDTATDSHKSLPIVNFTKERLEEVELYPYKKLFQEGLTSVMVAHLSVPSIEPRENYPSSLSYNVVTDLLQKELGFEGLIFTDALNMKGASNYKKPGEIDLAAFLAGNDILLFAEDVPKALTKIKEAYNLKLITDERIAQSVKKILKYKYRAGLNKYKPIDTTNLIADLNLVTNDALQYNLYENAITVIKKSKSILPISNLNQKIAYIKMGDDYNDDFITTLKKYTEVEEVTAQTIEELNTKLKDFDIVIIGFHKSDKPWKNHDFTDSELDWLQQIAANNKVILDVFAKPYSLLKIKSFSDIENVIVSYQNNKIAQQVSAEIIFGAVQAVGKLPVSISDEFKVNTQIITKKYNRLGFASPENVGMSSIKLAEIEKFIDKAIKGKMAPGMQVLVARKGKVIYQKAFGYHTYENKIKVKNTDIYDVASLTKMVATLPIVMKLYDDGKVKLDTRLGKMLLEFKGTNKDSITFKELLSHYGRLQAWIPFYKSTLDSITKKPLDSLYRNTYTEGFTTQVSENLFLKDGYHKEMMKQIINSELLPKKIYKYSDLTFIILKDFVERITRKPLDLLSQEQFFKPIGMNYTMYNPLRKFDLSVIPPTEIDNYFRHSLIQGYVHDMAAAMDGGVDGHAGIFSNTMDIAKMMQLFLQTGNYGNHKYFSKEIMDVFNNCYYCEENNRRGLGFDKPQLGTSGPTCGCVSNKSFGHTGFTGTMAWADPDTELIYVFLSNRTYPDSNASNKLSRENIREDIQKIIQESIIEK